MSNNAIPSTLIRYGGAWLLEDLLQQRMSASKVSEFNDPFEGNVKSVGEFSNKSANRLLRSVEPRLTEIILKKRPNLKRKQAQKIAKRQLIRKKYTVKSANHGTEEFFNKEESHRIIDKTSRIICFVDPNAQPIDDTRMWGYYSENHTGVRVHIHKSYFEKRGVTLNRVNYQDAPPEVDFTLQYDPKRKFEYNNQLQSITYTKSLSWKHECEIRAFILNSLTSTYTGIDKKDRDYIPLPASAIARIDIGIKAEHLLEKAKEIQELNPTILLYQTILPSGKYYPEYKLLERDQ